jgi:hypothetical protein
LPSYSSIGSTASEQYLNKLARRSFLSLWSYSNLYTDEGRRQGGGDGKELCDLVVIFGRHVLLFSDKTCSFPVHKDVSVAWGRWFRKAVQKSARQLLGAERWLRDQTSRVFVDKECGSALALPLPANGEAIFHRIAVTRGAHEPCKAFFGGGSSGSPIIDTTLFGDHHLKAPFRIGHVTKRDQFIHVLDELTLDVVLRELDTVSDFVGYLEQKEALLSRPRLTVLAMGEEELVAIYLRTFDEDNHHHFPPVPENVETLFVEENHWTKLKADSRYLAKKKADEISYFWDQLIESFIENGADESGQLDAFNFEPALRQLASENRLARRHLAHTLYEAAHKKVRVGQRYVRLTATRDKKTAYVFLIVPQPPSVSLFVYQRARQDMLVAHCRVAKLLAPGVLRVVGIALEPARSKNRSEDLALLETTGEFWTEAEEAEARRLQSELNILTGAKTRMFLTRVDECPRENEKPVLVWRKGTAVFSNLPDEDPGASNR